MKHPDRLKWHVNVVIKPGLNFECVIIKRSYKSYGMKIENVMLDQNYALFLRVAKSFGKNLKKNISLFSFRN